MCWQAEIVGETGVYSQLWGKSMLSCKTFSLRAFFSLAQLFISVCVCDSNVDELSAQVGTPAEEDLLSWAHHSDSSTIPDAMLQAASRNQVLVLSNVSHAIQLRKS